MIYPDLTTRAHVATVLETGIISNVCLALSDLVCDMTRCTGRMQNTTDFNTTLVMESRINHSAEEAVVARLFSATLLGILGREDGLLRVASFIE